MTLLHGDLFAGLGGFSLGAQRAGMQTAWSVEIDPIARGVLARHWPDVARYEDVTTVSGHDLAPVDVITAGFPCQDLSVAGKRVGLEGARSGLFWEITRIVTEMREATNGRLPAVLLLENVPGWLSSHRGRDFGVALDGLADCGALDIGWRILDARHFRVAQRRRRLFLVCDFIDRRASQVLFEPNSLSGHPAPRREARQATAAGPPGGAGSGGGADLAHALRGRHNHSHREDSDTIVAYQATGDAFWREGVGPLAASDDNGSNHVVASAITASAGHHGHSSPQGDGADNLVLGFYHTNRNPEDGIYEDMAPTLKTGSVQGSASGAVLAFSSKDHGADVGTTSPTLRAMNYDRSHLNGGGQVAIAFATNQREEVRDLDDLSVALNAQPGTHCQTFIAFDTTQITSPLNYSSPQPGDPCHPLAAGAHPPAIFEARYARNGRGAPEAVCPPLKAQSGQTGKGDSAPLVFRERTRAEGARLEHQADLAYALTNPGAGGRSDERSLVTGMTVRRLTPTECSRLQAYPDGWIPDTIADSHHYRLLGNSVCVAVVEWLMRRVVEALT